MLYVNYTAHKIKDLLLLLLFADLIGDNAVLLF